MYSQKKNKINREAHNFNVSLNEFRWYRKGHAFIYWYH